MFAGDQRAEQRILAGKYWQSVPMLALARSAAAFVVKPRCPCPSKMRAEASMIAFAGCCARLPWLFSWAGALILRLWDH
ncbi:hypothetical protein SKA58_01160 [Sphingomonas sp. SKA58]|nr:hypothetical protein SKA58_01160 [Sphingomonas sp. SKA58]|tara:strand:- start:2660 stop:2896 length:237 start_codon:yes stop_codon:yes gene_type:complete